MTNVFDIWSLLKHFNNALVSALVLLKQLQCLCWSKSWVTALVSPWVHTGLKKWKCLDWRCIQNEDGVNNLFSLYRMVNSFVWKTPSSRFAFVDLKVLIAVNVVEVYSASNSWSAHIIRYMTLYMDYYLKCLRYYSMMIHKYPGYDISVELNEGSGINC